MDTQFISSALKDITFKGTPSCIQYNTIDDHYNHLGNIFEDWISILAGTSLKTVHMFEV